MIPLPLKPVRRPFRQVNKDRRELEAMLWLSVGLACFLVILIGYLLFGKQW